MKATTIKVDGDLLRELERTKPPSQSLEDFIAETAAEAMAPIGNALATYLGD